MNARENLDMLFGEHEIEVDMMGLVERLEWAARKCEGKGFKC